MQTVLIADDNPDLQLLVRTQLIDQNYLVQTADDGAQAIQIALSQNIDLAILDIMMPKKDGFAVTKAIRAKKDIPILILTAKSDIFDKQKGYEAGADDYLTKPFDIRELVFKMRALFRRYNQNTNPIITAGALQLDQNNYSVRRDDQELFLPRKEFEILATLAQHPNQIFSRDNLILQLWGPDYEGSDRTVDVHIKRLRAHLAQQQSVVIKTVRGLGYRLEILS